MDIEGFEYEIFESWPELAHTKLSENILLPHQILVEVRKKIEEKKRKFCSFFVVLYPRELLLLEFQSHHLNVCMFFPPSSPLHSSRFITEHISMRYIPIRGISKRRRILSIFNSTFFGWDISYRKRIIIVVALTVPNWRWSEHGVPTPECIITTTTKRRSQLLPLLPT